MCLYCSGFFFILAAVLNCCVHVLHHSDSHICLRGQSLFLPRKLCLSLRLQKLHRIYSAGSALHCCPACCLCHSSLCLYLLSLSFVVCCCFDQFFSHFPWTFFISSTSTHHELLLSLHSLSKFRWMNLPCADYPPIIWNGGIAGGSFYILYRSWFKADFRKDDWDAERSCSISSSECQIWEEGTRERTRCEDTCDFSDCVRSSDIVTVTAVRNSSSWSPARPLQGCGCYELDTAGMVWPWATETQKRLDHESWSEISSHCMGRKVKYGPLTDWQHHKRGVIRI